MASIKEISFPIKNRGYVSKPVNDRVFTLNAVKFCAGWVVVGENDKK